MQVKSQRQLCDFLLPTSNLRVVGMKKASENRKIPQICWRRCGKPWMPRLPGFSSILYLLKGSRKQLEFIASSLGSWEDHKSSAQDKTRRKKFWVWCEAGGGVCGSDQSPWPALHDGDKTKLFFPRPSPRFTILRVRYRATGLVLRPHLRLEPTPRITAP